jgi:phosphoribosylglycinamide formyltransferase-1
MSKRLVVLISGRGSNMQAIVRQTRDGILKNIAEVVAVISNKVTAAGLEFARQTGIETRVIPSKGKDRISFDRELLAAVQQFKPDLVVLAGFMRILTPEFIRPFKDRIINIHPADTDQFKGLGGYEWAWKQKLPETKITVHLVDEGVDTGRVLAKATINMQGLNSLHELEERGLQEEHRLYSRVIKEYLEI